jgi:hypothetical protein
MTAITHWESPSFVELRMDAEIGSYQADEPADAPPFARESDVQEEA